MDDSWHINKDQNTGGSSLNTVFLTHSLVSRGPFSTKQCVLKMSSSNTVSPLVLWYFSGSSRERVLAGPLITQNFLVSAC